MEKSRKILTVTAITIVTALVCFAISALSAGVGHGSYLPFAVFFPYAFLASDLLGGIGIIAAFFALAQFPGYGAVLGRAWVHNRLCAAAVRIAIVHSIALVVCAVIFITSSSGPVLGNQYQESKILKSKEPGDPILISMPETGYLKGFTVKVIATR